MTGNNTNNQSETASAGEAGRRSKASDTARLEDIVKDASPAVAASSEPSSPARKPDADATQHTSSANKTSSSFDAGFKKVYISSNKTGNDTNRTHSPSDTQPVKPAGASQKTQATSLASDGVPREVKAAYDAGAQDPYELKEMMARGAESVLYRAVCGAFTFCSKSIRNSWSKLLGGSLPQGTEKLENVKYSTKLRHIQNEYEISKKLFQPEPMPVVRMYGLRKVTRIGKEIGYDLLLEYLEGHDLGDKMLCRVMPLDDKVRIMYQSFQALDYVHHRKIIHLDIKPSNFMLVKGRVKLIDFGVSVMSGHRANAVTGTGGYLSPEQICKDTIDERTDVFAMGVAFAVLFGGKPLVQPQEDLMSKRGRQEARYSLENQETSLLPDVPGLQETPLLLDLLRQCTIPRRDKRPASCTVILHQIRQRAEKYGIIL